VTDSRPPSAPPQSRLGTAIRTASSSWQGKTDINVNSDNAYTIPVETVTTDTYLDSATYEIAGTTEVAPGVTPEPASVELVLSGLGAIAWRLRRRTQKTT
jgi:hypothetical protein